MIELTSLLDVILILLFVLLTQAKTQTAEALSAAEADRGRAADLEREVSALREEADGWKRQVISEDLVLDHSHVVTISAETDGTIRLEQGEAPAVLIPYNWANETYARNRLRSELNGAVASAEEDAVFLVFQYDRGAIYRAEYDMIENLLQEAKLSAKQKEVPLSVLELDINKQEN